jgi:hypothetical protein
MQEQQYTTGQQLYMNYESEEDEVFECDIPHTVKTHYEERNNCSQRTSNLYIKNVCWGTFSINSHLVNGNSEPYQIDVLDIFIQTSFRNYGFSRILIDSIICDMKKKEANTKVKINNNNRFYIETDVTDGFWDYVGAVHLPLDLSVNDKEYGYNKYITWEKLNNFCYYL